MASNRNNSGTNFEPSLVARVSGALRYAITGKQPAWFSPLEPLAPVAPAETAGRKLDYQSGYNLNNKPRSFEPVSFDQMRALADGLDILRIVIETRKDQLAALEWTVKPKDKDAEQDHRCDELKAFFAMPDQEHTWSEWLRMLLEDLFVIDAPTLYVRKTKGGEPFSFEAIDGATIKRVIDGGGRTPTDGPAYQQILKGMPAVDYTRDELIYKPRNPRTHKIYGYSPVEQIITAVNIAIRREISQLSYYTVGSTPDLIFSCPPEWNPDQISQFKDFWDEMLAGNVEGKRGTMFVPAGVTPVNTKDQILKDAYDEWLARIVCYAFSVSPTPFIKETNRATAESAMQAARMEGLIPLMNWVRDLINSIIVKYFGYADLEFAWVDQAELDPLVKAQVSQIYVQSGVMTADEVRADLLSMPPLTDEQKEELKPPAPPLMEPSEQDQNMEQPPAKKLQAPTVRKIKKINRNRKAVRVQREKLTKSLKAAFAKVKAAVIAEITKADSGSLTKGKAPKPDGNLTPFSDIDESEALDLLDDDGLFLAQLQAIALDAVEVGFAQINYSVADALAQANDKAIDWAQQRAAELVGKRVDADGNIIDNPNAEYRISDSTRDGIKSLVTQATEEGWTVDELTNELQNAYVFSDERADMIACTETAFADVNGNMIAYRESGVVVGKKWLVAAEACDDCQANADQGVIDLEDQFQDGSDCAPAHPRCLCDTSPVVNDEE